MKKPIRVTVALDEESYNIFNSLRDELNISQSELVRRIIKFYSAYRSLESYDSEKIMIYIEMLAEGEHVILDIDHLITFLRFIESHPDREEFWKIHRDIAKAHAEQFKGKDVEYVLRRLEACNFFRINRIGKDEWTLILVNEVTKNFVRIFLEEVFRDMGFDFDVRENLTKLRLKIKKSVQ